MSAPAVAPGRARAARPTLADALDRIRSEVLASDPGALRFRAACRTTSAVALTAVALVPLVAWNLVPAAASAVGVTLSLLGASLPREAAPRARLVTILAMGLAAALASVVASALVPWPLLDQTGFLLVLFGAIAAQTRGVRAVAVGLVAVVNMYLILFLRADLAALPAVLAAIPVSTAVVAAVSFVLIPEHPLAVARRMVRDVGRQAANTLVASLSAADGRAASRLRLRRRFAVLNETVLSVEDQLLTVDDGAAGTVMGTLMRLELGLIGASACIVAAGAMSRREAALVRLSVRRLGTGRRSGLRPRGIAAGTPLLQALADLDRAAADLAGTSDLLAEARAAGFSRPAPSAAGNRPAPAWRPAIRATAAAFLSMVGGQMISPDRWFWAVLTAYLVFLGARSSGDMIHKGFQRVGGTLVGLGAGLVASAALAGDPTLEVAALLGCVFGLAYVFAISQTLAIFCVTVMLGLVYSMLGVPAGAILTLRLEETVIGAVAAIVVGLYVLPASTHEHVRTSGLKLLDALAAVVRASARRLAGDGAAAPVAAMRRSDRVLRDLRAALAPLQARRTLVWWARQPSEMPAILVCIFWVRILAMGSEAAEPGAVHEPVRARADEVATRIETLAEGRGSYRGTGGRDDGGPIEIGTSHVGQASEALLDLSLTNLETVLDLMGERFRSEGWSALVARRRL